jgi:formylglycine-generating enzyme required for sulfatase activity
LKKILILSFLALGYQTASAQLVTESFGGTGANAFTMDFITIGNPNNVADTTGSPNPVGSVAYTYNLGKYEVSRNQIDKANSDGSLGITMSDLPGGNGVNRPATGVSWYEAATYVNWLNTSTGGAAAYKFSGNTFQLWSTGDAGYNANNMFRNSLAKYVIASRDEWYKGAYGKADGSWSNFPNGSDIAPTAVAGGTDPNTAVYLQPNPADINNAGGLSAYGTMAQGGNVWEWTETAFDGSNNTAGENRSLRGGAWSSEFTNGLNASYDFNITASHVSDTIGFRVAAVGVPEPSALSLLAIGLGGLALVRRRK